MKYGGVGLAMYAGIREVSLAERPECIGTELREHLRDSFETSGRVRRPPSSRAMLVMSGSSVVPSTAE